MSSAVWRPRCARWALMCSMSVSQAVGRGGLRWRRCRVQTGYRAPSKNEVFRMGRQFCVTCVICVTEVYKSLLIKDFSVTQTVTQNEGVTQTVTQNEGVTQTVTQTVS